METRKIKLPFVVRKPVLALGSQTKNTVCFAEDKTAYLSSEHPDLSSPQDVLAFKKAAGYFLKKKPVIIACDLHPEYQSTKFAHTLLSRRAEPDIIKKADSGRCRLLTVQHHHAHIASCMVENGLKNQKVIGVAFDGTGLGADGSLWGAEFLICDYNGFKRGAYLKEIALVGADKAISEPYRIVLIWLYQIYGDKFLDLSLGLLKKIDKDKWPVLKNMYLKGINSFLSSSMGRLFDAAGSLVLEKTEAKFEAEFAIGLEKLAQGTGPQGRGYNFNITAGNGAYVLDPLPMLEEIVSDMIKGEPKEKIAYRFHLTAARMIEKVCLTLRKQTRINDVVLSGGVFQNKTLLALSLDLLYRSKFKIQTHNILSCSDLSISLGQMAVANSSLAQ